MSRCPAFAVLLMIAITAAWWRAFVSTWSHIDEAVDERNGHYETEFAQEFAPSHDPANAEWD